MPVPDADRSAVLLEMKLVMLQGPVVSRGSTPGMTSSAVKPPCWRGPAGIIKPKDLRSLTGMWVSITPLGKKARPMMRWILVPVTAGHFLWDGCWVALGITTRFLVGLCSHWPGQVQFLQANCSSLSFRRWEFKLLCWLYHITCQKTKSWSRVYLKDRKAFLMLTPGVNKDWTWRWSSWGSGTCFLLHLSVGWQCSATRQGADGFLFFFFGAYLLVKEKPFGKHHYPVCNYMAACVLLLGWDEWLCEAAFILYRAWLSRWLCTNPLVFDLLHNFTCRTSFVPGKRQRSQEGLRLCEDVSFLR